MVYSKAIESIIMLGPGQRRSEFSIALLICVTVIVSFDALAAELAVIFAASYGAFIAPQIALYLAIGFALRRRRMHWVDLGIILLTTSAVEASAGSKVAEWIGPGRVPSIGTAGDTWAFLTAALVTTAVGILGGALARIHGPGGRK